LGRPIVEPDAGEVSVTVQLKPAGSAVGLAEPWSAVNVAAPWPFTVHEPVAVAKLVPEHVYLPLNGPVAPEGTEESNTLVIASAPFC
jgi:hypothetical protein